MGGPHRRDREERERDAREMEEKEALKHMTEAERRAWEAAHPKVCPSPYPHHHIIKLHRIATVHVKTPTTLEKWLPCQLMHQILPCTQDAFACCIQSFLLFRGS